MRRPALELLGQVPAVHLRHHRIAHKSCRRPTHHAHVALGREIVLVAFMSASSRLEFQSDDKICSLQTGASARACAALWRVLQLRQAACKVPVYPVALQIAQLPSTRVQQLACVRVCSSARKCARVQRVRALSWGVLSTSARCTRARLGHRRRQQTGAANTARTIVIEQGLARLEPPWIFQPVLRIPRFRCIRLFARLPTRS